MISSLIFLMITAVPFSVTTKVSPGPYLVGQGIEIRVETSPTDMGSRADFSLPSPAGFEVIRSGPDRFVIVPRKPGTLEIPPIRVHIGDKSTSTTVSRLTIAGIPSVGRSPAFLGGVGAFDVSAEVEPRQIRLGQTVEYRITLTGPAAWGSVRGPDLASWSGLRVEPREPALAADDPPRRTFLYRVRPSKAGKVILPPVAVASYLGKGSGFATKSTPGLSIEVVAPPRFDPSTVNYGSSAEPGSEPKWTWWSILPAGGLIAIFAYWLIRRRSWLKRANRRQLASEIAASFDPAWTEVEAARRITEGLARYLEAADGRPPGVLTPPEARQAIDRLTADTDLADRVARLIERCDGVWFGGRGSPALVGEAREILDRLDVCGNVLARSREVRGARWSILRGRGFLIGDIAPGSDPDYASNSIDIVPTQTEGHR